MFLETANVSNDAIHLTLGSGVTVLIAKIARDWFQERNGNNTAAKLDVLISIGVRQQEALDELVIASRVAAELRKARAASG